MTAVETPMPIEAPREAPRRRRERAPSDRDVARGNAVLPSTRSPASPRVEAVIPLVHVPDDPGPEPHVEPEPELPIDARGRLRPK